LLTFRYFFSNASKVKQAAISGGSIVGPSPPEPANGDPLRLVDGIGNLQFGKFVGTVLSE